MADKISEMESDNMVNTYKANPKEDHLENKMTSKAFRQSFTRYFLVLLSITSIIVTLLSFLLLLKSQQNNELIEQQLIPIKVQLQEISYLTVAADIIETLLTTDSAIDYLSMQRKLNKVSHKLSDKLNITDSEYRKIYQSWFIEGKKKEKLATRISQRHSRNQNLKLSLLEALSSLLRALKDKQISLTPEIIKIETQLQALVITIDSLNIGSSIVHFEQLRLAIDELFSSKFVLTIRQKQAGNDSLSDFEQMFTSFESLLYTQGYIAKWQGHLRLANEYHQELANMQQQVNNRLSKLTEQILPRSYIDSPKLTTISQVYELSVNTVLILSSIALITIFSFFIYFFRTMRISICRYSANNDKVILSMQQTPKTRYSDNEFEDLSLQHQTLKGKLSTSKEKQDRISLELELLEYTNSARTKTQFIAQQGCSKELYNITIKQLVEFAPTSYAISNVDECLYSLYLQSKVLAMRLKQAELHNYLQTTEAILSLSDVNLIAEVQAVVLNQSADIVNKNNQLLLTIAKDIQADVRLDAKMFSEMTRVFIQLLLAEQSNVGLIVNLTLQDKNDGQQCILFKGQVQAKNELAEPIKVKLPKLLQYIHSGNHHKAESELLSYFYTLLVPQHGEHVLVSLTEQGYQLSFTLPLAVMFKRNRTKDACLTVNPALFTAEQEKIGLLNTYQRRPIEVLLSIKEPEKHQVLLQLLQGFGLQVFVVTRYLSQQKHWKSGRYTLLITEFTASPFIQFTHNSSYDCPLMRGVLTLGHLLIKPAGNNFTQWQVAELTENANTTLYIKQLATLLSPWLKTKLPTVLESDKDDTSTKIADEEGALSFKQQLTINDQLKPAFDLELYIVNQGSAELALYMLDDYVVENLTLVTALNQALALDDFKVASDSISSLLRNGKILAATKLINFCHHWQALLSMQHSSSATLKEEQKHNNSALQVQLMIKTEQEVAAIARYAQVV